MTFKEKLIRMLGGYTLLEVNTLKKKHAEVLENRNKVLTKRLETFEDMASEHSKRLKEIKSYIRVISKLPVFDKMQNGANKKYLNGITDIADGKKVVKPVIKKK